MNHETYMRRCIELAKLGEGTTHPNPMVGAVVVEGGEIIGEGWHRKAGTRHAEVHAIESVKDKSRLTNATIYVSLEPCSHYGKTPPCALRIIEEKIPKVVIGTKDPHRAVAGQGIDMLEEKGINVQIGVLQDECVELNRAFFTYHRANRPYITLKWAQTADGFITPSPDNRVPNEPVWITGLRSKQRVHKLRNQVDAILVGGKTVVTDNPSLTTRIWSGSNPQRIIWTNRPVDQRNTVMNDGQSTWIIGPSASSYGYEAPIESWDVHTLHELLFELYERGIVHLLVEGGASTLDKFIEGSFWDEAYVLTGQRRFEAGVAAPHLKDATLMHTEWIDQDIWQTYRRQ